MTTASAASAKSLSGIYHQPGKLTSVSEEQQIDVSKRFLKWLARPLVRQIRMTEATDGAFSLLDIASGPGVVAQELHDILPRSTIEKSKIVASDSSPALVDLVKRRITMENWINTEARVLDAMDIGFADNSLTHVTVAMGLHIIPQPDLVLRDIKRMLNNGGILGLTTPHNDPAHSMWQPDIRSAFESFPFDAPFPEKFPTQMHDHGHWADPEWVGAHLETEGFENVQSRIVRGTYHVDGADDFLATFGSMLAWVMNGWWPEETRATHDLDEIRELTRKHLARKHHGEGWDIKWAVVCATGEVVK